MKKNFSIDARTILTLGRDSIKDHTTALLELVKNSYDADATKVDVEILCNSSPQTIRIADNGCGMTEKDVDENWLRIGYSEKRVNRISTLRRRKTGEKGIGRISADRLGVILTLITKAKNENVFGLKINWDDFDVTGKDLSLVPMNVINKPKIKIPKSIDGNSDSGTELIIEDLRQSWSKNDMQKLYNELSILTPPFKKVEDFNIFLKTDVTKEFNGIVKSSFFQVADTQLDAEFDGANILYSIKSKYEKEKKINSREIIDWKQIIQRTDFSKEISGYPSFGKVQLTLLFYPREATILQGTEFRLSDLREFLDKNAGVKIYRDNIRVKPYGNPGEPEGDWLGLAERKTREPAGISRPTWRVAANQIVGAVFVSRDSNPNIVDSSSREGLIQGEAFNELRALVFGCLTLLEAERHKKYVEQEKNEERKISPADEVTSLNKELITLRKDLDSVKSYIPKVSGKPIERTLDQVASVSEKIKDTKKSLDELISQARVLRGLATIGIASAVFGHETQSSISEFISATYTASTLLIKEPPKVKIALDELEKAKKYADQVSSWGAFALARVQRDKRRRRKLNIKRVIEKTLQDIEPVFKASNIETKTHLNNVEGRTFAMDVEAILLNLMTNAYTACQQVKRKRVIRVELRDKKLEGKKGFEINVSDSGPGIDDKLKDRIWDPLFTTKVDKDGMQIGTGLGLTIVQSITDDLSGTKNVDKDVELKGAKFNIWLPSS